MDPEGTPASRSPSTTRIPTELVLFGVNHRTGPIDLREALLRKATYPRLRRATKSPPPWDDLVLLSTCNRIEAYAVTRKPLDAVRTIRNVFEIPEESGYELGGSDAAAHLLRVASGLDSLAQGESQVTAQVRKAASLRPTSKNRPVALERMFERAAREAPHIRSLAGLTGQDRSASHAALEYIRAVVPLPHPTIALLGTGKMARIAAASLSGRSRILVINRDRLRAREVAEKLGGRGYGLEDLDAVLSEADVVIAATSTRKPLVTRRRAERARSARGGRPIWFIDLGFPRNIDAACCGVAGVTIVDIDSLAAWGAWPLAPAALARAEERIHRQAERLVGDLRPASETDIGVLRRAAEDLRRREVAQALSRLPGLSESDRAVVDKLATRLVNRFLHGPTERLRSFPEATRLELVQELLRGMEGGDR